MLPPWVACTQQVPGAAIVAVEPETVQMEGVVEVKTTGKPEVAEALRSTEAPVVCAGIAAKVMVWESRVAVPLSRIVC